MLEKDRIEDCRQPTIPINQLAKDSTEGEMILQPKDASEQVAGTSTPPSPNSDRCAETNVLFNKLAVSITTAYAGVLGFWGFGEIGRAHV